MLPLAATSLTYLDITGDVPVSDLPDLSNIVRSHPTLEVLNINRIQPLSWEHNLVSPLVKAARNSQLKKLTICKCDIIELINTNPKELIISDLLIQPLAALLPNITSLVYLEITGYVSYSDLAVLTNIVQSHPTLEELNINNIERSFGVRNPTEIFSLVEAAGNSRLKKLTINKCDVIELLNYANTNPTEVIIPSLLIQPLAALLPNITSLVYLEITGYVSDSDLPVLSNIVRSHPTLEVLDIIKVWSINLTELSLLVEATINSQLKEIRVDKYCYDKLPSHFREAHK